MEKMITGKMVLMTIKTIPFILCWVFAFGKNLTDIAVLDERTVDAQQALYNTSTAFQLLLAKNLSSPAPFYGAQNNGYGLYTIPTSSTTPLFPGIQVNMEHPMFYQVNGQIPYDMIRAMTESVETFQNSIDILGRTTWQYIGGPDFMGIYPLFRPWLSGNNYKPTARPWWTSSTIGNGNYILVLDISSGKSSSDFIYQKSLVKEFIESLSDYDYFGLIIYDVATVMWQQVLTQATQQNKEFAATWLQDVVNNGESGTNIGPVIATAQTLLQSSIKSDSTSNCHTYTLIFSQGEYSIISPHPYDLLIGKEAGSESSDFMTISIYTTDLTKENQINEGITCRTGGFVKQVSASGNLDSDLYHFNEFYSQKIRIISSRSSAVYDDAFGLGKVTTNGMPIYGEEQQDGTAQVRAVIANDIVLEDLISDNFTVEKINQHLYKNQICEDLDLSIATSNLSSCPAKSAGQAESDATIKRNKGAIFGVGVTLSLLFFIFITVLYARNGGTAIVFLIVCWILLFWFWMGFGLGLYPELVDVAKYQPTDEFTVNKAVRPYECTRTTNCVCGNFIGQSCGEAAQQLLAPGSLVWNLQCQTGYHCCQMRRECASQGSRCRETCTGTKQRICHITCRTYCRWYRSVCDVSVNNRACQQVRGTCNVISINVQYETHTGIINSVRSKTCGLNATSCRDDFLSEFPAQGKSRAIWYDKTNPDDVRYTEPTVSGGMIAVVVIPAIPLVLIVLGVIVYECRKDGIIQRLFSSFMSCFKTGQQTIDGRFKEPLE